MFSLQPDKRPGSDRQNHPHQRLGNRPDLNAFEKRAWRRVRKCAKRDQRWDIQCRSFIASESCPLALVHKTCAGSRLYPQKHNHHPRRYTFSFHLRIGHCRPKFLSPQLY